MNKHDKVDNLVAEILDLIEDLPPAQKMTILDLVIAKTLSIEITKKDLELADAALNMQKNHVLGYLKQFKNWK